MLPFKKRIIKRISPERSESVYYRSISLLGGHAGEGVDYFPDSHRARCFSFWISDIGLRREREKFVDIPPKLTEKEEIADYALSRSGMRRL